LKNKSLIKNLSFKANIGRCPICNCNKFTFISSDASTLKHGIGRSSGASIYFNILEKGPDDRLVLRIKKTVEKIECRVLLKMCNDCGETVQNIHPNNTVSKHDRKRR
jgi:predicted  nucleic acid-binding Zn-ribbon protein